MKYNNGVSSVNIYEHPLYRALKKAGVEERDAVEAVHSLILRIPNMLTKQDIKNFATKDDFDSLKEEIRSLKEDISNCTTKDETNSIKKDIKNSATKDDFDSLKEEIKFIKEELKKFATKEELARVEKKLDDFIEYTNQRFDKLEAKIDSLSKIILGVMVTTWGFSTAAIVTLFFMVL